MGFIFDNIGYTGLFENAVQKVSGYTPGHYTVGSGWTNRGVVGCNTSKKNRSPTAKKMRLELPGVS